MRDSLSPSRDGQQLLSERQAATWLGVCPRTLWGLRTSGKIAVVHLGRAIRYDIDDLRGFVERNKKGGDQC